MTGLQAIEPDQAMPRGVAEYNSTVYTLGRDLEEIRYELRSLAHVDPTETGNAASLVGMDVEDRNTVLERPLQSVADGVGPHHCAHCRIA